MTARRQKAGTGQRTSDADAGMGLRRRKVQWHPCLARIPSTHVAQVATRWAGSGRAENVGVEMAATWSTRFRPTRGRSLMEETDGPTPTGIEYHVGSHAQARAGTAVGMREKPAPGLQAPAVGTAVRRMPGAQKSGGAGEQVEMCTGPKYIAIISSSL